LQPFEQLPDVVARGDWLLHDAVAFRVFQDQFLRNGGHERRAPRKLVRVLKIIPQLPHQLVLETGRQEYALPLGAVRDCRNLDPAVEDTRKDVLEDLELDRPCVDEEELRALETEHAELLAEPLLELALDHGDAGCAAVFMAYAAVALGELQGRVSSLSFGTLLKLYLHAFPEPAVEQNFHFKMVTEHKV